LPALQIDYLVGDIAQHDLLVAGVLALRIGQRRHDMDPGRRGCAGAILDGNEDEIGIHGQVVRGPRRVVAEHAVRVIENGNGVVDVVPQHVEGNQDLIEEYVAGIGVGAALLVVEVTAVRRNRDHTVRISINVVALQAVIDDIFRAERLGKVDQKGALDHLGPAHGVGVAGFEDIQGAIVRVVVEITE